LLDEELNSLKKNDSQLFGKDGELTTQNAARIEQVNAEIATLNEIKGTEEKESLKKITGAADDAKQVRLKKEKDANEALLKARRKFIDDLLKEKEDDQQGFIMGGSGLDVTRLKELDKEMADERKAANDREFEMQAAHNDRMLEEQRQHEEMKRALRQAAFDFGVELVNTIFAIEGQNRQAQIQDLEASQQYELGLTGDNAKAKEKVDREFNNKKKQLMREQAQAQKEQAMFNILVSTAESILRTGAQLGYPAAIPFQLFAGLTGALQLAVVANSKLPKFAAGIFGLEGPGNGTSDSILAMLSRGESVVPEKKSSKFAHILKPMIEDPSFDEGDLRKIVDQSIPSHVRGDLFQMKVKKDDTMERVLTVLEKIERKPVRGTNIDAKGVFDFIEDQNYKKKVYREKQLW